MKTTNEDPNYRPIQFALNRAVFHGELTEAEADAGIAEHAALVAVAELLQKAIPTLEYCASGGEPEQTDLLEKSMAALAALAALRARQPLKLKPGLVEIPANSPQAESEGRLA